jgi:hypothetical protein
MAHDLSHSEVQQEDSLLIEAVSLLVQRQRETESWVAEQIDQAEARAATVERRYTDLESRLAGVEDALDRLAHELEPGRGDAVAGQRLARLREQVEDLRSDTDGRPLRSLPPVPPAGARGVEDTNGEASRTAPPPAARGVEDEPARTASVVGQSRLSPSGSAAALSTGVLDFLGPTPRDRFGVLLIFVGVVAVLYAVLTQLRLG